MTWKLKEEAKSWQPVAGVPWNDMTDEEFERVCAEYDRQHEEKRTLERWFTHVKESKKAGGKD